jgi:hypothetical protein
MRIGYYGLYEEEDNEEALTVNSARICRPASTRVR